MDDPAALWTIRHLSTTFPALTKGMPTATTRDATSTPSSSCALLLTCLHQNTTKTQNPHRSTWSSLERATP